MHLPNNNAYIVLITLFKLIILVHCNTKNETNNRNEYVYERAARSKFDGVVQKPSHSWSEGLIPFYLDTDSYDTIIAHRIRSAMNTIESSSCVRFMDVTLMQKGSAGNWLHITNPKQEKECVHQVNTGPDGETMLVLGFECMKQRDILHSLLHALGFKDEVSHPQRDQFVRVMWENIQPRYRPLFHICMDETPHRIVEYDTMSVMHFHDRAFSFNGGATIAPIIPGLIISPSENLSQLDIMKLQLAFGHECNKRKVGKLVDTCQNVMRGDDAEEPLPSGSSERDDFVGHDIAVPVEAVSSASDSTEAD